MKMTGRDREKQAKLLPLNAVAGTHREKQELTSSSFIDVNP